MRICDNWQQYEILDANNGQRLERWGDVVLVRPDPQVIWKAGQLSDAWGGANAVYHRSEKGGGGWEIKKQLPKRWNIKYGELTFIVSPTGFKHTGIFPEQAVNWDMYKRIIENAGREVNVLNLFGYTGGATLACAAAGAKVCHVDASKGIVEWAKENAQASGLGAKPIRYIIDDCAKFVAREIRRGVKYDAIIMDPPSYGRGPAGEVWKLEDSIFELIELCGGALSEKPLFFSVNTYTAAVSPAVSAYILQQVVTKKFGGNVFCDEIGLRVKSTGGALPCGSTAVWLAPQVENCY